ncbi:GNAT family N-acetyltransferase [Gluconobacter kondonii]|uniref:GNAT family N-acetyltransferase n=1 Tax=Gluconobacter kondonii TaxID=941463 RepID=UPI001B8B1B70|nr:GNAT family N-acetyltransferase [Gluconobacter kondonii]MBS1058135.1 N-acetyltransferase [Gluconobacter kondonii]
MPTLEIRPATIDDAEAITDIYGHHVRHGTASFDYEPRTLAETIQKIQSVHSRQWPFLIAIKDSQVVGYAYATQFRDRPAYSFACENSIYVHYNHLRQGVGKALLAELLVEAQASGFRQMIAVVGGGEPSSVALHAQLGFEHAGCMRAVGRKFGQWLDTVYLQAPLGGGDRNAPEKEPVA